MDDGKHEGSAGMGAGHCRAVESLDHLGVCIREQKICRQTSGVVISIGGVLKVFQRWKGPKVRFSKITDPSPSTYSKNFSLDAIAALFNSLHR